MSTVLESHTKINLLNTYISLSKQKPAEEKQKSRKAETQDIDFKTFYSTKINE